MTPEIFSTKKAAERAKREFLERNPKGKARIRVAEGGNFAVEVAWKHVDYSGIMLTKS